MLYYYVFLVFFLFSSSQDTTHAQGADSEGGIKTGLPKIHLNESNIVEHGGIGPYGEGPENLLHRNGYWKPDPKPWYVIFDFHHLYTVGSVELINYGDTTHDVAQFTLETADDITSNDNYKLVSNTTNVEKGTNDSQLFTFASATGRYWRFQIIKTHDSKYPPLVDQLTFHGHPANESQDCSIYDDCNQCLAALHPYCGWCPLESKCSLRKDCRNATQDHHHWVNMTGSCNTMWLEGSEQQRDRVLRYTLMGNTSILSSAKGALQCVYNVLGQEFITEANYTWPYVSCDTKDMLPEVPHNEHHYEGNLTIRMIEGPEFLTSKIMIFDCNTISSCTECGGTNAHYSCSWCIEGHLCTWDYTENCRNDVIVNNYMRPADQSEPSVCPVTNNSSKVKIDNTAVSPVNNKSSKVKTDNIAILTVLVLWVSCSSLGTRVDGKL